MIQSQTALAIETCVRSLKESDYREWDEFVLRHPIGTPFHLTSWRQSIEATFGYTPYYLMAMKAGRVTGVLPLFLIKNLFVGRALISSPFAVYGGVLADSDEAKTALRDAVKSLGKRLAVQYVELRNANTEQCLGFSKWLRYVTFTQEIGRDKAAILKGIPRKVRYMVRKSCGAGFFVHRQSSDITALMDLYSRNVRRLGTPVLPEKHFVQLLRHFKGSVDIREITLGDKVVAAVLTFYFRDQILPYYGASDPGFNDLAPNNFMYYHLMEWGAENGYTLFDFGRSKKSVAGSYDFKAHWGMVERVLPYEMLLVRRKELPNFSPVNPVFRPPMKIWSLLPLALTRKLGPKIVKLFP